MSAYSNQQFCVGKGDQLKLQLHAHPDLPHLMLTISMGPESQFTLSAANEQLGAIIREIAALFEGPALEPDQKRTTTHGACRCSKNGEALTGPGAHVVGCPGSLP